MLKGTLVYVLWVILVTSCSTTLLQGQSNSIFGKSIPALRQEQQSFNYTRYSNQFNSLGGSQSFNELKWNIRAYSNTQVPTMPKVYNFDDLGFFCKVEVLMEKKTKMPIKIRLGEVQYVERMEGKYEFPLIVN